MENKQERTLTKNNVKISVRLHTYQKDYILKNKLDMSKYIRNLIDSDMKGENNE